MKIIHSIDLKITVYHISMSLIINDPIESKIL